MSGRRRRTCIITTTSTNNKEEGRVGTKKEGRRRTTDQRSSTRSLGRRKLDEASACLKTNFVETDQDTIALSQYSTSPGVSAPPAWRRCATDVWKTGQSESLVGLRPYGRGSSEPLLEGAPPSLKAHHPRSQVSNEDVKSQTLLRRRRKHQGIQFFIAD